MTPPRIRCIVAVILFLVPSMTWSQEPDALLPKSVFAYWEFHGTDSTEAARQKTAAYHAFDDTGLMPAFDKLIDSIPWQQILQDEDEPEASMMVGKAVKGFQFVKSHGVVIAAGFPDGPAFETPPYGAMIVRNGAQHVPALNKYLKRMIELGPDAIPDIDTPPLPGVPVPFAPDEAGSPTLQPVIIPNPALLPSSPPTTSLPAAQPSPASPQPFQEPALQQPTPKKLTNPYRRVPPSAAPNEQPKAQLDSPVEPTPTELLPNSSLPNSSLPNSSLPNSSLPNSSLPSSSLPLEELSVSSDNTTALRLPISLIQSTKDDDSGTPSDEESDAGADKESPEKETPAPDYKEEKIGDRTISRARVFDEDTGPIEWACWAEGEHLVFYIGQQPVTDYLQAIDNPDTTLASSSLWQDAKVTSRDAMTETSRVWLDFDSLLGRFSDVPIPDLPVAVTLGQLLEPLGVTDLQYFDLRYGYEGRLLTSSLVVQSNPESTPKGIQALFDQPRLRLSDIPPLPVDVNWFRLVSLDIRASINLGNEVIDRYAQLFGPEAQAQWQMARALMATQDVTTFEKILDCLGPNLCVYNDAEQEILGWGPSAVAVAVEDTDQLESLISNWRKKINENPDEAFRVVSKEWEGCTLYGIVAPEGIMTPTFAVCDGWLVAGIQPQTVKAFVLRSNGDLPRWSAEQIDPETRKALPERFIGMAYSDPSASVRFLVSLVPWGVDLIRYGSSEIDDDIKWSSPITALDIPPAEMVTSRLFPNVSVSTYENGRYMSHDLFSTRAGSFSGAFLGYYLLAAGMELQ